MKHIRDATALQVAWRHKFLVGTCGILATGIAVALAFVLPPIFQSSAQVLVVAKRPDVVAGADRRQNAADEYVTPAQELLKSPLILERAAKARNLQSLPTFADEDKPLAEAMAQALLVTPVKAPTGPPNVFKLTYRSSVAEDCPMVLAAILDTFKEFMEKKLQSVSDDTVELLLKERDTLGRALAEKEAAYRKFREEAPFLGKSGDGSEARQESITAIQAKKSAVMLRRVELESQIAAAESALQAGRSREAVLALLVEFAHAGEGSDAVRERQIGMQEYFALLLDERKLLETYGPKHPDVENVQRRLETARGLLFLPSTAWQTAAEASVSKNSVRLAGLAANSAPDPVDLHLQVLRQKCQQVKSSEEVLAKLLRSEQEEARRLGELQLEDESFRTSIAFSRQLHETLIKRLGDASLLRNAGGYDIEEIETPSVAKKVGPSLRLFGLVGAFLGGLLGLGLAYSREFRSGTTSAPAPAPIQVLAASVRLNAPSDDPERALAPANGDGS